ncbi:tRNA(Met) cytidine acetate ligase [Candidatus Agathobaculum pullicola]|uniref:tRNA(Met) cytidine acetate ligase n=1 Tax=Candidatus Agathobaculum pullicola TaxID=2838426 RepID=UPI003F915509
MTVCGIVAEYNPFHAGHAHHLTQTRRALGADTAIVCAMSGNFVQRGDLAVMEKYRRAEAAVRCGADLVLETPLSACLWSASGFAFGAVALLDALGCVTHLSFGAERADLALLRRAANLSRAEGEHTDALRQALAAGLPYAAAIQQAVSAADPEAGALLTSPNNTLAIEYLCALDTLESTVQPLAVLREGGAHDSDIPTDGLPSASYLRKRIAQGDADACRPLMPEASFAMLTQAIEQGAAPVTRNAVDQVILAHLRRLTPDALARYCGGDGLEHRLCAAIRDHTSLAAVCAAAQTRRYPLARVRRALMRAWLDLSTGVPPTADYVRVLAVGARGRDILRRMKDTCKLPVIVKPVTERTLPDALQSALAHDALADDLYALAYPDPMLRVGGDHFRKSPFCLS